MLKTISITVAIAIGVLVAALLAFAATRPDTFRFERTIGIEAPPAEIFTRLDDFREWRAWSPWEKLDPALERRYSGAASGTGAVYAWEGNSNVGAGRMEITEAVADTRIRIALDFLQPLEAHQFTEFQLAAAGGSTHVTWTMHGPTPFLWKLLAPFVDFDSVIGSMLETGLANLKAAVENGAPSHTPGGSI